MKNGIPGKLVAQLKIKKFIGVQSVVAFETLCIRHTAVHYLVPF
jgi:hypothetical protein